MNMTIPSRRNSIIPNGTEPYLRESVTPTSSIAMRIAPMKMRIPANTLCDPLFNSHFPHLLFFQLCSIKICYNYRWHYFFYHKFATEVSKDPLK